MPNLCFCRCHGINKQNRYSSNSIPQPIIAWHLPVQFEPGKLLISYSQYRAGHKEGQSTVFRYIAELEGSCLTCKTGSELCKGRSDTICDSNVDSTPNIVHHCCVHSVIVGFSLRSHCITAANSMTIKLICSKLYVLYIHYIVTKVIPSEKLCYTNLTERRSRKRKPAFG